MHFDDFLKIIGGFGRYQKFQFFLICLVSIISAFHSLNMVFIGAKPDYHCAVPVPSDDALPENTTASVAGLESLLIPENNQCEMYNLTEIVLNTTDTGLPAFWNGSSTVPCQNGWTYSREVYGTTIVTEFDLVCDRKWLISTSKSLFFAGRLIGAIAFGQLSDRFGRRKSFFIALALLIVAGCGVSGTQGVIVFLVLYVIQGIAQVGVFLTAFTIATELVAPKYRVVTSFVVQGFYAIGYMGLAGLAYVIREWRYLELSITLPALLFVSYWWLLPESIRWLLSRGRIDEANEIVKKAARINKIDIEPEILKQLDNEEKDVKTYTFIDLLRNRHTAILSLNVWFNWMVNAMVYYGLSLDTGNLGGDPYVNLFIAGAVEIPAYILCILLLNRAGRKIPLIAAMLVGGIACILTGYVPKDLPAVVVTLAMVGKFCITASYAIIYLMGAEVFPTVLRNVGMGMSSMSARIGGILCPLILDLRDFYKPLPLIIFGVLAIVAGLLALFIPETRGRKLPQTLLEMTVTARGDAIEKETPMSTKNAENGSMNITDKNTYL